MEAAEPLFEAPERLAAPPFAEQRRIWNRTVVPHHIQPRLFERHVSTKGEPGRGLGTYSMKLLGERYLGGQIRFVSEEAAGTCFSFRHPRTAPRAAGKA